MTYFTAIDRSTGLNDIIIQTGCIIFVIITWLTKTYFVLVQTIFWPNRPKMSMFGKNWQIVAILFRQVGSIFLYVLLV